MTGAGISLALVNAVIAVTLIEGVLLLSLHVLGRRGPAPSAVIANLGAGLCLLAALHAVLDGSDWPACAAWLAGAGVSHALDVWCRLRHVAPGSSVPLRSGRPS